MGSNLARVNEAIGCTREWEMERERHLPIMTVFFLSCRGVGGSRSRNRSDVSMKNADVADFADAIDVANVAAAVLSLLGESFLLGECSVSVESQERRVVMD